MAIDLEHFGVGQQLRCSSVVRAATQEHRTMESAARALCRTLYQELRASSAAGAPRGCVLVRCYKTHPYGALPADLQRFARGMLAVGERPRPSMRCLTLLASAGDEPAWNSRHESRGHRAIPLPSPDLVEKAPMIAQLVRDFGLGLADVVEPTDRIVHDRRGKNYGVFHVEEAADSPLIPAQAEFVRRHRVRSVVGFGGLLASGDLFAVVLFARVRIDADAADRFRGLAIDVKTTFFAFGEEHVFDPWPGADAAEPSTTAVAT